MAESLRSPGRFVSELARFLEDNDITPGQDRAGQATQVLAGSLRHHGKALPVGVLEAEHRPLLGVLRDCVGWT